ncbi:MAG TPA: hypothetical protein VGV35_07515 [Bryobacteraceae bacterium]|nr:hypothetical protein [Bryobacteraceae bacterium]
MTPSSIPLESSWHRGTIALVLNALLWGVPAALLAALAQGVVALRFDFGILYLVIGIAIGRLLSLRAPRLDTRWRQGLAVVLTYLAIALSPIVPFINAVGFDPVRIGNAAVGLILAFLPEMSKLGFIGILNIALLLIGVRNAWIQSRKAA